ncbi:MAG: hydantoinase/oxoprolinase family protein, partial [Alphaproteobacteria bacterium]|nr:hydantoinase/oxoprolinase family protein [Alphaproteobacteria bacterium]
MAIRVAIDTGGTFTDVVAIDEASGAQFAVKTPSTPDDPSRGLVAGFRKAMAAAGRPVADAGALLHGSTVATNAVLEHKFDGLGLIVTHGFRYMIEIARQSVPDGYGNSFFWVKPPRLVPLHLVREVPGRMTFEGREIEPFDAAAARAAVAELVAGGARCIGVCLLHAYANDDHESQLGALIAREFPNTFFSLSSVVLPEYREYERAMTTLIDVLVKPYCRTYLGSAARQVRDEAGDIPFLIMQSNGGVVRHETAGDRPVTMLLSGPAAGVLGAVHMACLAGFEDILTLDVGGTSTDVSLVDRLRPAMTSQSTVEHYPVKTPMFDIVTVAAGGGSIAWVDGYGRLKVGPQSAGADPGPVAYGRGGTRPAVTDAALVMGR